MTTTITNHGPTTGTYYEVLVDSINGAQITGMSANCLPAQLANGCRVEDIPVGSTVTIQVYFQITSCASNNYGLGLGHTYMPFDPVTYEPSFGNSTIKITGC
jgi:hypothetical protein